MSRWAVLTSGGDAPGMNAAVHAFARAAAAHGASAVGVRRGFVGLLEDDLVELDPDELAPWSRRGGTLLGTSRLRDFPSRVTAVAAKLDAQGLDGLVVLGGNGSMAALGTLARHSGATLAGIPATIDNDVAGSDESLGFDTAVNTALELLDRMRDSAEALPRLFALETLGGTDGHLARAAAHASHADAVLDPDAPLEDAVLTRTVTSAIERRGYALVVASEGYARLEPTLDALAERCGLRLRFSRLGHAQRGGAPSYRDRDLGRRFGEAAAEALALGRSRRLSVVAGRIRATPLDHDGAEGSPAR